MDTVTKLTPFTSCLLSQTIFIEIPTNHRRDGGQRQPPRLTPSPNSCPAGCSPEPRSVCLPPSAAAERGRTDSHGGRSPSAAAARGEAGDPPPPADAQEPERSSPDALAVCAGLRESPPAVPQHHRGEHRLLHVRDKLGALCLLSRSLQGPASNQEEQRTHRRCSNRSDAWREGRPCAQACCLPRPAPKRSNRRGARGGSGQGPGKSVRRWRVPLAAQCPGQLCGPRWGGKCQAIPAPPSEPWASRPAAAVEGSMARAVRCGDRG